MDYGKTSHLNSTSSQTQTTTTTAMDLLNTSPSPISPATESSSMACGDGARPDVRSTAVVQYSDVKFPVQFQTIRLNTDLKCLPNDWGKSGNFTFSSQEGPDSRHRNQKISPFLSINMAHCYQDFVGQVDVISSSKNIKDLLKMPYKQSPQISIMVHRLGKTLLLEEFDVYKNLFKKQAEEWTWLKSYFDSMYNEDSDSDKSRYLVGTTTGRDSFTEPMYLNLIRHSLAASAMDEHGTLIQSGEDIPSVQNFEELDSEELKGFHHESLWKFEDISMLIDSDLPIFGTDSNRPCISLRLRDARSLPINVLTGLDYWLDNLMSNVPEVAMCYHLNGIVQKYEVIRTEDIPHLENSRFNPNEVMDIARNIMAFIKSNAAVEGHTYWLYKRENDDMVKLYDLTDYCKNELSADDNPFTVPVGLLCYRVGRNLKVSGQRRSADARTMLENCIRLLDGSKHAQVLSDAHYHLSDMWVPDRSINDIWQEGGKISETPSDLYDDDESSTDEGLDSETPVDDFEDLPTGEYVKPVSSSRRNAEEKNAVALKELVVRGMSKRKAWEVVQACRIAGETDERCREALQHIRKGLNDVDKSLSHFKNQRNESMRSCSPSKAIPLRYCPLFPPKDTSTASTEDESACMQSANPFVAIPLHYSPLHTDARSGAAFEGTSVDSKSPKGSNESHSKESSHSSAAAGESVSEDGFPLSDEPDDSLSWHIHVKYHLLRKAAITYFVLAEEFFKIKKYGHALRHLRYAVHCHECLGKLCPWEKADLPLEELDLLILYLAAKTRSNLSSSSSTWSQLHKEFEEIGEEEAAILHSAQAVISTPARSWIFEWPQSVEENMKCAVDLYQAALRAPGVGRKSGIFLVELKKYYAGTLMGIGNLLLDACKEKINKNEPFESIKPIWERGLENYRQSSKMFESVGERNTMGHISNNIANMYVVAALAVFKQHQNDEEPMSKEERDFLQKAIMCYEKALTQFDRGEHMDDTRETIYQNLRNQYYQMAYRYLCLPGCKMTIQMIGTMKELLQKSLHYCHMDSKGKNSKKRLICAAVSHLNLGRVFEVESNNCPSKPSSRLRSLRQKCEEHLQQSFKLYRQLNWCRSEICVKEIWIKSQLDVFDLKSNSVQAKKKSCRAILFGFCDLRETVNRMRAGEADSEDDCFLFDTNESAVKQLISTLNKTFCLCLKTDKTFSGIKVLYQRCLYLPPEQKSAQFLDTVAQILNELKKFLSPDNS